MRAEKLAKDIKEFLTKRGSVDAKIVSRSDISLHYGLTIKADAAVDCKDRDLNDMMLLNKSFENLAVGNDDCFGVPYGRNLMLIFDTTE